MLLLVWSISRSVARVTTDDLRCANHYLAQGRIWAWPSKKSCFFGLCVGISAQNWTYYLIFALVGLKLGILRACCTPGGLKSKNPRTFIDRGKIWGLKVTYSVAFLPVHVYGLNTDARTDGRTNTGPATLFFSGTTGMYHATALHFRHQIGTKKKKNSLFIVDRKTRQISNFFCWIYLPLQPLQLPSSGRGWDISKRTTDSCSAMDSALTYPVWGGLEGVHFLG